MSRRRAIGTGVVLAILAGVACGGGGGPTGPPPPPAGITFSRASSPTPESVFLSQGAGTGPARLFLEVRVNEVVDFYGVAFDLQYPSAQLTYVDVNEGDFLGANTTLEVVETSPGVLVVGHTRLGSQPGRDGSGELMTLEFLPAANGSGSFAFANEQAFRTNSFPQTVEFIAGSVSVQN